MDTQIKLKDLVMRKAELEMELSGKKKFTMDSTAQNDSPQARLSQLNDELLILKTKYTDKHPDVLKVESEIKSIKKEIELAGSGAGQNSTNPVIQHARDELARTDSEIQSLQVKLAAISRQEHAENAVIGGMPGEQEEWDKLQRDRSVYQKLYDDTLQRLEDTKASKEIEMGGNASMLRVVDPAVLPIVPVKPDRVRFILIGLVLGAASGIGAALGLDYMDNSFLSEEGVEAGVNVPVLVSIPRMATEEDKKAVKRKDIKIFGAAGVYVLAICVLLVREFLFRYMGIKIGPF